MKLIRNILAVLYLIATLAALSFGLELKDVIPVGFSMLIVMSLVPCKFKA